MIHIGLIRHYAMIHHLITKYSPQELRKYDLVEWYSEPVEGLKIWGGHNLSPWFEQV